MDKKGSISCFFGWQIKEGVYGKHTANPVEVPAWQAYSILH